MSSPAAIIRSIRPGPRFEDWVLRRVQERRGPTHLPLLLEYRHVYVMPTVFGAWFGLLLAATALGGLNFNNNMALLLGFLLAAVAQLTSVMAYRTLAGLSLCTIEADPVFAGEPARFRIHVHNPESRPRFSLQARAGTTVDAGDIGPGEMLTLNLLQPAPERGWLQLSPFNLESRFPLGLFRAWSVIIPTARCLVYPRPASDPPPLPRTSRGDGGAARKGDGDEFHGLRGYRPGDPLRSIAWRASARHDRLHAREMETPREQACELNWYLMKERGTERKISVLTAWVLRAEKQQLPYSLELPGHSLPAGLGAAHRDTCLSMLALFQP